MIKKIILKQVGPYDSVEVGISKGITLLKGKNGSGKTFIVDGFLKALFNLNRGAKVSEDVKKSTSDTARGSSLWEVHFDDFRVRRVYSLTHNTSQAFFMNLKTKEELSLGNKLVYRLKKLGFDADTFMNTCIYTSESDSVLINGKGVDKYNFVCKFFNLDILQNALSNLKTSKIKPLNNEFIALNTKLSIYEDDRGKVKDEAYYKKCILEAKEVIEKSLEKEKTLNESISLLEKKQDEHKKIQLVKQQVLEIDKKIELYNNKNIDIEKELEGIEKEVKEYELNFEKNKELVLKYEEDIKQLNTKLYSTTSVLEDKNNKIIKLNAKKDGILKDIDNVIKGDKNIVGDKIKLLKDNVLRVENDISKIEVLHDKELSNLNNLKKNSKCPTCYRVIEVKDLSDSFTSILNDLTKKKEDTKVMLNDYKKELEIFEKKGVKLELNIKNMRDSLLEVDKEKDTVNSERQRINEDRDSINFELKEIYDKKDALKDIINKKSHYNEKKSILEVKKKEQFNVIENFNKQKKDMLNDLVDIPFTEKDLVKLDELKKELQNEYLSKYSMEMAIEKHEENIKKVLKYERDILNIKEEIKEKKLLNKYYGILEVTYGKQGVTKIILNSIFKIWQELANSMFKRFKSTWKLYIISDLIKGNINIEVDDGNGVRRNTSTLSKGEKCLLSIVLRISMLKVKSNLMKIDSKFLILDEVFDRLDANNSELLLQLLNDLKADFPQILVISHSDINLNVDSIYEVIKSNKVDSFIQKVM